MSTKKTISTVINYYRFDISNHDESVKYDALCDSLKSQGLVKFDTIASQDEMRNNYYGKVIKPLNGKKINLELDFVFNNQWNTGKVETSEKGLRVFDWAEPIYPNKKLKQGMYLIQTEEMQSVRANTCKCGYCGKNYYKPDFEYCTACLGSEYLEEKDLFLLYLVPVVKESFKNNRDSIVVPDSIVKEYKERQMYECKVVRPAKELKKSQEILIKKIEEIRSKSNRFNKMIEVAEWLKSNKVNTSNFIFYDHSQTICIGWQRALSENEVKEWQKMFSEKGCPHESMIEFKTSK